MAQETVLVIEDDAKLREALRHILGNERYEVTAVDSGERALALLRDTSYDIVLTDVRLPGIDGMEVLRALKLSGSDSSVIVMTAYASIDSAVAAIKEGAEDYIAKPFSIDQIRILLRKVVEKRDLILQNTMLRGQLAEKHQFRNIIGVSEAMQDLFAMMDRIKDSSSSVLILGETGSGKELVASALHYESRRRSELFLPINCAAVNENLVASELFGHVKGAFTTAVKDAKGSFEIADNGTVFLDEIGDISPSVQAMLLRVLESGEIQPVGSSKRKVVDVRIVAATNRDLEARVHQGLFREDLYYRLNTITLTVPPLRNRVADIGVLSQHFLAQYRQQYQRDVRGVQPEALALLERYPWPGNVRELRHAIEHAVLLEAGDLLSPDSLPLKLRVATAEQDEDHGGQTPGDAMKSLKELNKEHVLEVLTATGGNRSEAARLLGVNRVTLWRMLHRYGIDDGQSPPDA